MKTYNAVIYHCQHCGNVVHREPEFETPDCCGMAMVNAAAETIYEDECLAEKKPGNRAGRHLAAPVMKVPPKG